jgi:hypothetical protein
MSLINEALKRAQRAQKQQPANPGSELPLEPVEHSEPKPWSYWLVPGGMVLMCVAAGCFLWLGWRTLNQKDQPAGEAALITLLPASDPLLAPPVMVAGAAALAKVEEEKVQSLAADLAVGEPVKMTMAQAPEEAPATGELASAGNREADEIAGGLAASESRDPPEPAFKLQGIYYRMKNPTALINGQTLLTGEEIDGAKVLSIERYAVNLLINGQTNLLTIRQQR